MSHISFVALTGYCKEKDVPQIALNALKSVCGCLSLCMWTTQEIPLQFSKLLSPLLYFPFWSTFLFFFPLTDARTHTAQCVFIVSVWAKKAEPAWCFLSHIYTTSSSSLQLKSLSKQRKDCKKEWAYIHMSTAKETTFLFRVSVSFLYLTLIWN